MKHIIPVVLFVGTLFGCKKTTETTCGNPACTKELRYVSVVVKDSDNNPYPLDSFASILVPLNRVLVSNSNFGFVGLSDMRGHGEYVIAADNNDIVNLTPMSGSDVRFIGYRAGTKVADKTFKIGHDCCHVMMRSTDTTIIVP